MSERDELEALRRVTREVRDQAPPELDWDRVEARLFERIDETPSAAAPAPARSWRVVGALALAAVILLIVGAFHRAGKTELARHESAPQPAAHVFGESGSVNGATLAVGDRVVADGHSVVVDHPGRARWTLDASGRASVAELGQHLTIALESGAVSAQVVPSPTPESFAIEVAGARVAVHGTRFRVERRADGLRVEVSEGVVAVGPAGQRGHTQGWLLRHGDSGEFSLDGQHGSVSHAETASLQTEEPTPSKTTQALRAPVAAPLPASPSALELEQGLNKIESVVRSCYDRNTPVPEKGVRVRVNTQLTATVARDGSISVLGFDPPLPPVVDACAASESKSIKLPASAEGASASRALILGS